MKIDGLFVRDIDVNEMDRVMVRSINDLAKQLGKVTVAEFVENEQVMQRLFTYVSETGSMPILGAIEAPKHAKTGRDAIWLQSG